MNESELQILIDDLVLGKTGIGWTVPGAENKKDVEDRVRFHVGKSETAKRIAILEAKIFAYEQIISKSNFAPMIYKQGKPGALS